MKAFLKGPAPHMVNVHDPPWPGVNCMSNKMCVQIYANAKKNLKKRTAHQF